MATRRPNILRRIWDRIRRVFINPATNEVISQDEMLRVLGERAAASKAITSVAIEQALAGEISFSEMESIMAVEVRNLNIQLYSMGKGGISQISPLDREIMSGILTEEYTFMGNFVTDIQSGNLSPAQVSNRYDSYMEHSRQSFWEGSRAAAVAAGMTQERRVLNPAEHCQDCIGYAAQGWVRINTLPRPGQASECRSNCKCTIIFR